jgi:hypothetical protein
VLHRELCTPPVVKFSNDRGFQTKSPGVWDNKESTGQRRIWFLRKHGKA